MKHKLKKFISILLAFIIMLSVLTVAPFTASAANAILWPVPGHTRLSQGWHNGNAIDISDSSIGGATVVAAMGGTVTNIFLCTDQHLGSNHNCNGFGTGIVINGDDGRCYQYAHMMANSVPSNVYYGARVEMGQKIGAVGTTGNSSGNHLHFGISIGKYWYNSGINPEPGSQSYVYSLHTHSYSSSVTKQPTCTSTGVRTFTCSCGSSYTESIPATGHKYTTTVIAPTTTEKGYTLHKCSVCGDSYKDNYINPPTLGSDGWYYCNVLPSDVAPDKYNIQYNNYYEKIQKTSPGSDWKNAGVVKNEWQNSGDPYTTYIQQPTSDSRVLVVEYYYHWCIPGAGLGSEGNYEQTSKFSHYDQITLPNDNIHITWTGNDNGHPVYTLAWSNGAAVACKSGEQCDGSFGYHDYRCKAWYKNYVYQNRVKIELYKYTKNSGWISSKDSSATSVEIRYKSNLGDVNSDGDITIDDVTLIQKYLVSVSNFTTAQKEFADVNNDGEVNIDDATVMQKYLAGAIAKLG